MTRPPRLSDILPWNLAKLKKERTQEIREKYDVDEIFVSTTGFIGITFEKAIVCLGDFTSDKSYTYDQISSVEMVYNDTSLTKIDRGAQALGALIGSAALGEVGAIVGGIGAPARTSRRIKKISLRVVVDDHIKPVHEITFFRDIDSKGSDASSLSVKLDEKKAYSFHAHLLTAMRTAARHANQSGDSSNNTSSTAQEIKQLWELKELGALTEDEFKDRKAQILRSSNSSEPNSRSSEL